MSFPETIFYKFHFNIILLVTLVIPSSDFYPDFLIKHLRSCDSRQG